MSSNSSGSEPHDCGGCALADRRTFLRRSAVQLGGLLAAFGRSAEAVAAVKPLPVGRVVADSTGGSKGELRTYAIPDADGVQIDKDNNVIIVRWLGSMFAFSLRCPHQNTSLRWMAKEEHFQCPKHRSEYAADGDFMSGRATRGMDRYAVRRDGKNIVVDLGKLYEQPTDPKGWAAASVAL